MNSTNVCTLSLLTCACSLTAALYEDLIRKGDIASLRQALVQEDAENKAREAEELQNNEKRARPVYQPLMIAAEENQLKIAQLLIDHGWPVDLNSISIYPQYKGPIKETALMLACAKRHREMAQLLIRAGADVNAYSYFEHNGGRIPVLRYAVDSGNRDLIHDLLVQGARVRDLTISPIESKQASITNISILAYAIQQQKPRDVLEALIQNDPKLVNEPFNTTLLYGWTPLMVAALYGNKDAVTLLLSHGADPNRRLIRGTTALDFAREHNHADIIAILAPITQAKQHVILSVASALLLNFKLITSHALSAILNNMNSRSKRFADDIVHAWNSITNFFAHST